MPKSFSARLTRAPRPHDPARGAEAWDRLSPGLALPELRPLIEGAAGSAPYLHRLIETEADWLADALQGAPEPALDAVLQEARAAADGSRTALGAALRRAKRRTALLAGLADLAGVWPLEAVTGALSDLADVAVQACLDNLMAEELDKGRLAPLGDDPSGMAGLFCLAMGKGGARELNYSSDIDLIFLFDESRHDPDAYAEARARLVKVVQATAQLLSKPTGEGYVFRTDLRLRPDPSVTPVCIGMETAERYYESLGRTWERAAFIKARAAAGDIAAGEAFLGRLRPFVWRRHLDFAAIRDAHDIRERIRAHRGTGGEIQVPGHDVKLGRGGIREIEFFAQTRQLITGGRDPSLRPRQTRKALAALAKAGWVGEETRAELDAAYLAHRELEHRLQMVEDRQTHEYPSAPEARARIAALCGRDDLEAFEQEILDRLRRVAAVTEDFFAPPSAPGAPGAPGASPAATSPFAASSTASSTAGAPRPLADPEALAARGFERPEEAEATIDRWRQGAIVATRSTRARTLLHGLEPLILDALASAASPDDALAQFDRFLSGLPAGVQILSLFEANPRLLDLIAEICVAAPRLAEVMGRSSRVIDAILATDFFEPLPETEALLAELQTWLGREEDYERKLDAARAWARETRFRMGVQLLRGIADAQETGHGFTAIAEAALRALFPVVEAEFARRHGPAPGRGAAVLALGRMGSREMTAISDLDLILLYDADGVESSDGPKPLASAVWYARFTQALIAAMRAKTAEGALYEIDMRLRPSGRQGTVATSLSSFRAYQQENAWTWERLALTRARAVAGHEALAADAEAAVAESLSLPHSEAEIMTDAAAMRARVAEAEGAARARAWALKRSRGGLMDIEFAAQAGLLCAARRGLRVTPGAGAAEAFAQLAELAERDRVAPGGLSAPQARRLAEAHDLQSRLIQALRVAVDGDFDPERAGRGLQAVLARVAEAPDLPRLDARLRETQDEAGDILDGLLPPPGPDHDADPSGEPGRP